VRQFSEMEARTRDEESNGSHLSTAAKEEEPSPKDLQSLRQPVVVARLWD